MNERGGLRIRSVFDQDEPPYWLGTDAILYPDVVHQFPEPEDLENTWSFARMLESVPEEASGGALALQLGREIGRDHGLRVARAVLELEPDDVDARAAVDQLLADDPAAQNAFFESLSSE